jgi:hypothetical protein
MVLFRFQTLICVCSLFLCGCGEETIETALNPADIQSSAEEDESGETAPGQKPAAAPSSLVEPLAIPDPIPSGEAESIIKAGLQKYIAGIVSDDEADSHAVLDEFLPTKAEFVLLLGEEKGSQAAEILSKMISKMKSESAGMRAELLKHGAYQSVTLIDVRKEDTTGRYAETFQVIPKTIPVYRGLVKYEKGTGGMSSFLVIHGEMVFVQGIEGMVEHLSQ